MNFLIGPVDDESVGRVIREWEKADLLINSPGGDVSAGLALVDWINSQPGDIGTICLGQCSSIAAIIFLQGDRRAIGRHSRICLHQPFSARSDCEAQIELDRRREEVDRLVGVRRWLQLLREDRVLTPPEALDLGIATSLL